MHPYAEAKRTIEAEAVILASVELLATNFGLAESANLESFRRAMSMPRKERHGVAYSTSQTRTFRITEALAGLLDEMAVATTVTAQPRNAA